MADEQEGTQEGQEQQDTSEGAQDAGTSEGALEGQDKGQQDEPKFNSAQMQQIASTMGRLIDKHLEEKVMPHLNQRQIPQAQGDEAVSKFNERLTEKIFGGDPVTGISELIDAKLHARTEFSRRATVEADQAVVKFAEKPNYGDVHSKMQKIARDKVINQNFTPDAAAEFAYHQARSELLAGMHKDKGESLEMEGSGRQTSHKRELTFDKLPKEYRDEYEKSKQYFKNKADFVAHLDPRVKKDLGY